ncbi:hypothetical protein ROZALSC1DRAFT_21309, partial [Rozella allomycis CSF55]
MRPIFFELFFLATGIYGFLVQDLRLGRLLTRLTQKQIDSYRIQAPHCYSALTSKSKSPGKVDWDYCVKINLVDRDMSKIILKDNIFTKSIDVDIINLFMFLVAADKLGSVKFIMENRYDWIFALSDHHHSVASYACMFNRKDILVHLIQKIEPKDRWIFHVRSFDQSTCLDYALKMKNYGIIELLLSKRIFSADSYVCANGDSIASFLSSQGDSESMKLL